MTPLIAGDCGPMSSTGVTLHCLVLGPCRTSLQRWSVLKENYLGVSCPLPYGGCRYVASYVGM